MTAVCTDYTVFHQKPKMACFTQK